DINVTTHENYARAYTHSTGVGAISVGVVLSNAYIDGAVRAQMNGSITGGNKLTVQSENNDTTYAVADFVGGGLGAINYSGTDSGRKPNGDTEAPVGSGASVHANDDVLIKATSHNFAESESNGATIGLVGIAVSMPFSADAADTRTTFDG